MLILEKNHNNIELFLFFLFFQIYFSLNFNVIGPVYGKIDPFTHSNIVLYHNNIYYLCYLINS